MEQSNWIGDRSTAAKVSRHFPTLPLVRKHFHGFRLAPDLL
jgi:hypothetical protein